MKKIIASVAVYTCSCLYLTAQTNLRASDARSIGLGGTNVTHSVHFNPSCLSLSTGQFLEANYINKYELKELSSASLIYGNTNSYLPFALHISSFGYSKYRESMLRLVLSKMLSSKWIVGVSMQYAFLQTELFEEEIKKISTDVGILFIPAENLLIGLSITDLPSVRLDDMNINNQAFKYNSIQVGFKWSFINNMLIAISSTCDEQTNIRFNTGVEYDVNDNFFFRIGFQTNPMVPSFGTGILFSDLQLDVAVNMHPQLGLCSGIGITYLF